MAKKAKGKWEKFRNEVIELDDCRCVRCGKSRDEGAVLQVHHKYYEPGRDYWDYPLSACETLCSGCHAKEHGIISPDTGWGFLSDHDLGSCCGICDYCGSSLRRSFAIRHPNWGSMDVGADCCDLLTGTDQASRKMDEHRKRAGRRLRFIEIIYALTGYYGSQTLSQKHQRRKTTTDQEDVRCQRHDACRDPCRSPS
jgi:hypothetical protein